MDRRLLRRAQVGTLIGGVLVGALVALASSLALGLGVLAGAAWSALNLRALEGLVAVAFLPRESSRDKFRIFLWIIAKMGVYGLALWILIIRPFPALGMVYGLTIMLAALVLAGLTSRPAHPRDDFPRGDDAEA
jgi:hypothetical protein